MPVLAEGPCPLAGPRRVCSRGVATTGRTRPLRHVRRRSGVGRPPHHGPAPPHGPDSYMDGGIEGHRQGQRAARNVGAEREPANPSPVLLSRRSGLLELRFASGFTTTDVLRIKALPRRRWVPERRLWVMPDDVHTLRHLKRHFAGRLTPMPPPGGAVRAPEFSRCTCFRHVHMGPVRGRRHR